MGGPENGNFPLLYVVKMSLPRLVVQKSLKTPLRNIKMAPKIAQTLPDYKTTPRLPQYFSELQMPKP